MKLIELYHKVTIMRHSADEISSADIVGFTENQAEKKRIEKEFVERFEKMKKRIENFEELLNQLNEVLANNYITVDEVKLSLASALWYLECEMKELRRMPSQLTTVDALFSQPIMIAENEGIMEFPRLTMLRHMHGEACYKAGHINDKGKDDLIVVDPYNLNEDVDYEAEFLLKLKTAVACAMTEIEV